MIIRRPPAKASQPSHPLCNLSRAHADASRRNETEIGTNALPSIAAARRRRRRDGRTAGHKLRSVPPPVQCGSGYRSNHCWISECDNVRAWLGSLGGVVGNGRIRPKSSSWICAACSRRAEGRARSNSMQRIPRLALCRGIPWGVRLVSVRCVGGEIA